ncbi:MAG: endo alpha-1,4 polygalactosaminidase [Bauldia litoralis]
MPKWVVIYTDKVSLDALFPFETIVLDSRYHPRLRPLIDRNKQLLGYISLGEVEKFRPHYKVMEQQGMLLGTNKNWPDSRFVDVRDPRWTRRVIEELVPALLHKGFNGIFLDTLDNPAQLERDDPVKYKGMTEAAVRLVKKIRQHFPRIVIMMNRGYEILPRVAKDIDIVLGESVYADYNFKTKTYQRVSKPTYELQVKWLKAAKARAPGLRIFTLDYWRADDPKGIERIYRAQRRNGFDPYVATIKLTRVIPEPGAK